MAHMKSVMTRWKLEPLKWRGLPLLPMPYKEGGSCSAARQRLRSHPPELAVASTNAYAAGRVRPSPALATSAVQR